MQKKIYFSCTYRKKAVPLHAFSQQMTNVHTALADRSRLCRDKKCQMSNDKCQMTNHKCQMTNVSGLFGFDSR